MKRILYLLYIWIIMVPLFLVITIITAVTMVIGCPFDRTRFFSYYPVMIWSRVTCHLALCSVKVKGRKHIDLKKSYVFVLNHQGAFDIFMIYGFLGKPIKWVMKAGIGKIPFIGAACRAAGFIFVDNSSPKAAARTVYEAEKCLKNGDSIVIFPEGSRTYNGKMIRFKKGAYQMAVDQHIEIIPVTLNGPFDLLPIGTLNIHRQKLEMTIHEPISTEGLESNSKQLQELADKTQAIIATALWDKYK